ncbi:MAG TPA: hypothetical protein VGA88_12645 [Burkholderiales bacterium]
MFHTARYLLPTLLLAGCATSAEHDSHYSSQARQQTQAPLAQLVRQATARFKDVQVALAEGYAPFLGCVSGGNGGAMGIHYVNGALLDGTLEASRPEALMYEPKADGSLRLVGVEYLTFAEKWHAANPSAPVLEGHVMSYAGSPNRYGIPPHYQLHVWAWEHNPSGTFADWNPSVSCEAQDLARKR